jgi:hypothetical protein
VFYPGETLRLLRDLPEYGLKQYAELRVLGVRRNAEGEIETVEAEFYRDGGYVKAEAPFEAVELVVARASLEQTAVMWELETPKTSLVEAAMNAILDSGFLMRDGVNVARLYYDPKDRWWKWGETLIDPTGAIVATSAPAWDGCVVALSGRQRYHLEFRLEGRNGSTLMLHERTGAYLEQAQSTQPAMSLMCVLLNLCGAAGARYCAFPVAQPWLMDEDWRSLFRQPLYPDFFYLPEEELPAPSAYFRHIPLTRSRAIWTSLPVKASPTEIGFERSERELNLDRLRKLKALGEKYYEQMYETRYGTSGLYSDAKEAFYDAIKLAAELGLKDEAAELEKRLANIKAVVRSQF